MYFWPRGRARSLARRPAAGLRRRCPLRAHRVAFGGRFDDRSRPRDPALVELNAPHPEEATRYRRLERPDDADRLERATLSTPTSSCRCQPARRLRARARRAACRGHAERGRARALRGSAASRSVRAAGRRVLRRVAPVARHRDDRRGLGAARRGSASPEGDRRWPGARHRCRGGRRDARRSAARAGAPPARRGGHRPGAVLAGRAGLLLAAQALRVPGCRPCDRRRGHPRRA